MKCYIVVESRVLRGVRRRSFLSLDENDDKRNNSLQRSDKKKKKKKVSVIGNYLY